MSGKVLSIRNFKPLVDPNEGPWAAYLRQESHRRGQLAAVTFGIELRGVSIMLESDWDRNAQRIDPSLGTCHPVLDEFFRTRFSPMTTAWVHDHPMLDQVSEFFDRYVLIMRGHFDFNDPRYRAHVKQKC